MKAVIEKSTDGGFSVYSDEVEGSFGYGLTEEEAKKDFIEILDEQAEFYKERTGKYPKWYSKNGYEVDYHYDLSGFFKAFPFINATAFAKALGINSSQMRKYKSGIVPVSDKQLRRVQAKYDTIVEQMRNVRF